MSTEPTETDQDQPMGQPADTLQPVEYSDFSDPPLAITEAENSDRLPKASDSFESSSEEEEDGSGGYMLLPQEAGEELQSDWPVEGGKESDWTTSELSCIPALDGEDSKSEQSAAAVGNERTELETASSGDLGATAPSPTSAMEESEWQLYSTSVVWCGGVMLVWSL